MSTINETNKFEELSLDKKMRISIYNKYKEIDFKNKYIIVMISKSICNVFNEDAIIIGRLFSDKKISLLGTTEQYLKLNFPHKILNNIIKEIKEKIKVEVVTIEETDNEQKIRYYKVKHCEAKKRFVTEDDVVSYINDKNDDKEQNLDFMINQIQRGVKKEYQLHAKSIEFYKNFVKYSKSYLPLKYKEFYNIVLNIMGDLIMNINLTRNIKNEDEKNKIHRVVSAIIDTIKDHFETLYELKAFKNYNQYKFLLGRVIEISKINNGILKKKMDEIKF